ncbi:hypothetical protein [Bacillus pumilus]|uniref:hypothetical protein n=1 Tax=Bacillus pumilus TaxID=1408 RepID=UPI0007175A6B|nr:hypothetical protein [Bacillus pumilus]KRU15918.1 hypothetical protein AS142_13185 [Bacillus pumilus]
MEYFKKLKEYNDSFTEADSNSLNLLAQFLFIWSRLKQAHNEFRIEDEATISLEKRMISIDKQINQHMVVLCIPLSQRLQLANDMAKVMIEERKLEQMNNQNQQPVNPLLTLLDEIEEMNKGG